MNPLITLLLFECAEKYDEEMNDSLGGCYYASINSEPSKYELFMNKHKKLDKVLPYIIGTAIGLLPITISVILWKLGGMW